jgi:anti-sigma factor ChrR (cupin superfamily)
VSCEQSERLYLHALRALPRSEALAVEAHISACSDCQELWSMLSSTIDSFVSWPTDVLSPSRSVWERLSRRVAAETGADPEPAAASRWEEPEWEEVAPGVSCKLLATDTERHVVSMLVRLAPGVEYPPHTHAGLEELHLLEGELWIDDRKLHAGDYSRAEAGTSDARVWSETGCTGVIVTSTRDVLR